MLEHVKHHATKDDYLKLASADNTPAHEHIGWSQDHGSPPLLQVPCLASRLITLFSNSSGEAEPVVDGACTNPYMRTNRNRTQCILQPRLDIGMCVTVCPLLSLDHLLLHHNDLD